MKKYLTLFGIILLTIKSFSQEIKKYSGAYNEISNREYFYKGEASYSYFEKDNERVYSGGFTYSIYKDVYGLNANLKISINGFYKNNLADGLWTYKILNPKKEKIYVNVGGNKHLLTLPYTTASGSFNSGQRNGKWELTTLRDKKTVANFIANFDKQKFISDFSFTTSNYSVVGAFNNSGVFDNVWTIKWKINDIPYESNISFSNGVLVKSITKILSNGKIIQNIDNSEFVNLFFKNLKINKYFSVVNDKIYILKEKAHAINSSYNLSAEIRYDINKTKKLGFELLYKSIDFWVYPIINGYDYSEYNIFSEIRKGIDKTEYKTEKEIASISEDELLKMAEGFEVKNNFAEKIKEKKRIEIEKQIAEEKRIKKEKRKADQLRRIEERLGKNLYTIDNENNTIEVLRSNSSKIFDNAMTIALEYCDNKLDKSESSKEKLKFSYDYIEFQKKLKVLIRAKTKNLDKQLKKIEDPKEIIKIINSYNNGN